MSRTNEEGMRLERILKGITSAVLELDFQESSYNKTPCI